jgi:SAM-dependent methyltransferase
MSRPTAPTNLEALYDSLARYHWLRRRLRGARTGAGLEMHKRLGPPGAVARGPQEGAASLNTWLLSLLDLPERPRVLDVGCGFGATIVTWARGISGSFVGLTASRFQARMARREAARLGLGERCDFRVQGYDEPIAGRFDVAVSIEALFHAPDLARTLRNLAASLEGGAPIVLVEDMAKPALDSRRDPDETALLAAWSTPRLHTGRDYRRALGEAGFHVKEEIDLTAQVNRGENRDLETRRRRLARLRRVTPFAAGRRVLDAFLGGVALERLYVRERMRYVTIIAVREGAVG